jgi:orotidine-5'-phosphate decarboxylase
LKEFSSKGSRIPIYSPGLITQGGDINSALEYGADYLIIGRAITSSPNPLLEMQNIHNLVKNYKNR